MFDPRYYLKELGFDPRVGNPTVSELKQRWRALCAEHHPDKGGSPEIFRRVMHAYKMLTDFEYQHKEMQNEMRTGKPNLRGDLNIRIDLKVPFEDVFFGRQMLLTFSADQYDENFKLQVGKIEVISLNIDVQPEVLSHCNGAQEVVFMGKGHYHGVHRGDAIILINSGRHPRFNVQGTDVYSEEKIPLNYLLKGGTIDVLTMYGIQTAKVLPGAQPGDKIRIPNCGVRKNGSHFVVIQPVFPTAAELKGQEWRGLEINWDGEADDEKKP